MAGYVFGGQTNPVGRLIVWVQPRAQLLFNNQVLLPVCAVFFWLFLGSLELSLFPSIFVPLTFSLCMESTSYVLSFRMVFFYLVTTGWILT